MLREDIANVDVAVIGRARVTRSAICVLCELPTTHSTPGMRRQFLGRALRVAAGHQNAGRGIFAMHAAHGLAHVFIGRGGDGAGVEHHEIGGRRARRAASKPLRGEQRFESGAIGLGGAAAEILDEELPHFFSL